MTDDRLAEELHSIAIRVLRRVRTEDEASGMSAARLSVLSVLVFGGAETVTELASAEQVAVPTMTRLLQGLERDGFVRRVRSGEDRRVVSISATAKGRRALEAARRRRVGKLSLLLSGLGAGERARLAEAMAVLRRELTQRSGPGAE